MKTATWCSELASDQSHKCTYIGLMWDENEYIRKALIFKQTSCL